MCHPTGNTAVNIRFDGVGNDQIGLNLAKNHTVLVKQLAVMQWIHTTTVNGYIQIAAAKLHQF